LFGLDVELVPVEKRKMNSHSEPAKTGSSSLVQAADLVHTLSEADSLKQQLEVSNG